MIKLILPLLLVLATLATNVSNEFKAMGILLVTFIFLRPLGKKELSLFIIANLVFVGSDIGAIQSGFFKFTNPDLFGLPYWEFFAWGFWVLYGYKILPKKFPTGLSLKALVLAILFSQSFALIQQKEMLLIISTSIVALSLLTFRKSYDFYYFGFFAALGILVETTGLIFNLWTYPDVDITVACVQFVVMWAGIGVFIPNIVGPFLLDQPRNSQKEHNKMPKAS